MLSRPLPVIFFSFFSFFLAGEEASFFLAGEEEGEAGGGLDLSPVRTDFKIEIFFFDSFFPSPPCSSSSTLPLLGLSLGIIVKFFLPPPSGAEWAWSPVTLTTVAGDDGDPPRTTVVTMSFASSKSCM